MTEQTDGSARLPEAATPIIKPKRSFSIVWVVPLVAILIGAWLIYKAVTEKGPIITITFKSAEGLEAGKTKIKYKDVEVGRVTAIQLSKDLSHVAVTAEMVPGASDYLTEQTRFWVVYARVSAGQVTGLGTLLSGAYIGIEPGEGGEPRREFEGLQRQPMVSGETPGRQFQLSAARLGSLNPGSPIYFRQIMVGQVMDYTLDPGGDHVTIQVFVEAPYDQFVRANTRFWLASGLDLDITANGLRVDTESVVSLLIGGIAFSNLAHEEPGPLADEKASFTLYETFEAARDDRYTVKRDYVIEFRDSVRGLSIGAPVEFRGMLIGSVIDIELQPDFDKLDFIIPVRVRLEPERLKLPVAQGNEQKDRVQRMVAKGFRAQLETGSLLTGQLFIDLDFHPDAPPEKLRYRDGMPVIPSVPSSSQEILQAATRFVKKLDQLPLEAVGRDLERTMAGVERIVNGPDLRESVRSLRRVMVELEGIAKTANADTMPRLGTTLAEMEKVLAELDQWLNADAPLQGDLLRMLQELAEAGRSISELADMLERRPEVLIQGKGSESR